MGIDASKSANRNRNTTMKSRRKELRNLICENLERRDLMAVDAPRLLSIAPNSGEIFSTTSANNLNESPRELVFRFDSNLDPTTIGAVGGGIRISRSGGDGVFGAGSPSADSVVVPTYQNFVDPSNPRVVVARFSQPLADDLYRVEVFGVDLPAETIKGIRDSAGDILQPRKNGTDRDTYDFNLELGTKIIAVVPQPIDRVGNVLSQRGKDIEVYFNDSELYNELVTTGNVTPNPTVVDPQYYNLILTSDSVSPNDDLVFNPNSITYDPALRKATLTFVADLDKLPGVNGSGTFRLRVGSSEAVASFNNNSVVNSVSPLDPAGYLKDAYDLGGVSSSFSTVINQQILTESNPLLADYPGSNFEPGHRDIQDESHQGAGPDSTNGTTTKYYSFMDNQSYGVDNAGRPLFSSITPDQKQRVREVFEFYSAQLGIDFIEKTGLIQGGEMQIVVGDMAPNGMISGLGDVTGVASPPTGLAIMDGAEAWDNSFGYGSNVPGTTGFFEVALHEIGHLLGLDHTYDQAPGTIMGSTGTLASNTLEQIFPGDVDVIHGQNLYRPDNRDVDLYRFVVQPGARGQLRAETFAERLNNSSTLDTYLTLLKRQPDGTLSIVAVNNNYFSDDSLINVELGEGEYFISVTGKGNEDNNPLVLNSGSGAVSQGQYQLRLDFKSTIANQISEQVRGSTALGSSLDGDGNGIAGGDFNFWFRTATAYSTVTPPPVRTLFVDKAFTGTTRNGSLANPFNRIDEATAVAKAGDIIRLVGDNRTPNNLKDDNAYEIGTGGASGAALKDGATLDVPRGVTLMIDAGAILKFGGSKILVGSNDSTTNRSNAAIQVLGLPSTPVYFTSYNDESLGKDTNPLVTVPTPGNWGGIEIRNDYDRAQGRVDREREGIFLNTISNADIRYGGGQIGVGALARVVSPIDLSEARPLILGNRISLSADAAISADPNSFEETLFTESRYQNSGAFATDYFRVGPDIRLNALSNNSVNGLFVRIDTLAGQSLSKLTVPGRFDDSEVTIVLGENLVVEGTPGGPTSETIGPNVSLLGLSQVAPTNGSTGFTSTVAAKYLITFVDRYGQESLPSAEKSIVVNVGNSVRLNSLPVATLDYVSRKIWRQENNAGPFKLVAVLNRDDTTYTDNQVSLNGALQTYGLTEVLRARRDASLVVDPGVVIKSSGGRIELGMSATMLAEGTDAKPIVFTSRRDDRFGAAGTFDTNNDGNASAPAPGDWSGIVSRSLGELSLDNSLITFGGGQSRVAGGFASFNVIELHQSTGRIASSVIESNASGVGTISNTNRDARGNNDAATIFVVGSQPTIINNVIRNNAVGNTAAISIDANSLNTEKVRDLGRSTGFNLRENVGIGNLGPLVNNNQLGGNAMNGMRVRGATLTTESVWDDTDIVHVLQSEIVIPDFHTYGGLRLTSKSDESLVVKLSSGGGFTASGRPLDITDRIGGSLQLIGSPGFPVVLTSLADDTIGAGFDFSGKSLLDTNGNGASVGAAGDWRSVKFTPFSNDRNVDVTYENESDQIASEGVNDFPSNAQGLGSLASSLSGGDENLRLGVTLTGAIASPSDIDVYRFVGTAGTMVWFDIDQTSGTLDTVVELIDGNGQIIAQSDNSIDESIAGSVFSNTNLVSTIRAWPMDQEGAAKQNTNVGTPIDFQGVNPLDAGMRLLLPGVTGSVNDYFVRIRSSNVTPETRLGPNGQIASEAMLQDVGAIRQGISVGEYKLQIRLQQTDEVPGSTVRFADIRFATTGIDAQGQPLHSQLVGEVSEVDSQSANNNYAFATVQRLGNVISNDRAGVSVSGQLVSGDYVDYYSFRVERDSIQQTSNTPSSHTSVVIDIDYADGVGRANTQMWIYRDSGFGVLELVAMADDSNILDDQPAAISGTDQSDLTRGSLGKRDAYIGPFELPQGDYVVAVTNKSMSHFAMQQFTTGTASGQQGAISTIRVEPIDSVSRIAEDRFDTISPLRPTTSAGPEMVAFDPGSAVPFNFSDVTLFVSNGAARSVSFANPLTGATEAIYSTDGSSAVQFDAYGATNTDLAVAPDGRGITYQRSGVNTDADPGRFIAVDIGNGGLQGAGSSLQTSIARVTPNSNPITFEVVRANGQQGDGIVFDGFAFSDAILEANDTQSFWGVARHAQLNTVQQPIINPADGSVTGIGPNGINRNILYRLSSYDGIVGTPESPSSGDRAGNLVAMGAGTNVVEHGYFVRSAGVTAGDGTISGFTQANGTVTGLTSLGDRLYAVTNQGELMSIPVRNAAQQWSDQYTVISDNGTPIVFSGLTAGPRNLVEEGVDYSSLLFGITTAGRMYAFDTSGVLQPIFTRGATSVLGNGLAGATGIDFSSLDVNLFHVSSRGSGDPSHGRQAIFSQSSDTQGGGGNSLRFGIADPNAGQGSQPGNWAGAYNPSSANNAIPDNSVAAPGGARGAVESNLIDLSEYSADDQPYLYFTYTLDTEDSGSAIAPAPGPGEAAVDTFRVYAAGEDGQWILLGTNNNLTDLTARKNFSGDTLAPGSDEFDPKNSGNVDAYGRNYITAELFDRSEWRQARISLAALAGKRDVKIRFEFSTAGDFRSADALRGGVELVAVQGERIQDGDTFTVRQTTVGTRTFEFDLGLVLNIPSGMNIKDGDQIKIGASLYTFTNVAGAQNIPFNSTDSPSQLATSVRNVLEANNYTVFQSSLTPNVLNVTQLAGNPLPAMVLANDYLILGADQGIIMGTPGVATGNVLVPVNNAMTSLEIREAIRVALAATFNVTGQTTNTQVFRVRGDTILLHDSVGMAVVDAGPLTLSGARIGDSFGPRDAGGSRFFEASRGARNNGGEGVQIDDIIIGFAERGETIFNVTSNPTTNTLFLPTAGYEPIFAPGSTGLEELETGAYQLEIRAAADYGMNLKNDTRLYFVDPITQASVGRTFNTNDRLSVSYKLEFDAPSEIRDGDIFTLSDGVNLVTFEFDVVTSNSDPAIGTAAGNIVVRIAPNSTSQEVARVIRDAINSPSAQALLNITAENGGDMSGSGLTRPRSIAIQLHGKAAGTQLGSLSVSANVPLTLTQTGQDTAFGMDLGDSNIKREQGQFIVSSSSVSNSSGYGINLDAGVQNLNPQPAPPAPPLPLSTLAGIRPYPGSVRNLITLNGSNAAPGAVVVNNIISRNGAGGINVSGDSDATHGLAPATIARITNNTLYGNRTGDIGINVGEGASPTILNNIVANFGSGISVVGATSIGGTVLGGNLYQTNIVNVAPGVLGGNESFPIFSAPGDPVFIDGANGYFYLKSLSQAIDSSIASLENRAALEEVKAAVGLTTSPILAPGQDVNGLRRSDDPQVNTPAGLGGNVFIDRGAVDRVDFVGPIAIIQRPQDNDSNGIDTDPFDTYLRVNTGNFDFFEVLLDERTGTGTDPRSITPNSLILTENGRPLVQGSDYIFGFSANSRTIRLTPLAGFWRRDSIYEMTLINKQSYRIDAPKGSTLRDGDQITVSTASGPVVLEFDSGSGVFAGAIAIPFTATADEAMVATQILKALAKVGNGVHAYSLGYGILLVDGATGISGLAAVSIPPIKDLADNSLLANRANSLTQFTIVMPEVAVDFGDAIERPGTGSTSSTLLADNGVRHALFPEDAQVLALGQFADGDLDGHPSVAANADDFESSFVISAGLPLTIASNGPAKLQLSAPSAGMFGTQVTIRDTVNKSVTYQFSNAGLPAVASGVVDIDLAGAVTSSDTAALFQAAILQSILNGDITGIISIQDGDVVSLGGSSGHTFDLSAAGSFVQRVAQGAIGLSVPANVSTLAQNQTLTINDGSGNTVVFQIINSVSPAAVNAGNIPVVVNIATATQASFAANILAAINNAISAGKLKLPVAVLTGSTVNVNANDEDGVAFDGLFNPKTPPVKTTITSTDTGFIDAWIDWNQDNDFDDVGEQVLVSEPIIAGQNVFSITTPAGTGPGYTTARFRLSATGGLFTYGMAVGGEVEDYVIEILPGEPPVAVNDPDPSKVNKYQVDEDNVLTVLAADGVLFNDTDADSLTFSVFDTNPNVVGVQPLVEPQHGVLELHSDGSFVYTPALDFFGQDTFVYRVTDPRMVGNEPATVTITVNPINDVPFANDDSININEDIAQVWSGDLFTGNDFGGVTLPLPGQSIVNEAGQVLRVISVQLIDVAGSVVAPRIGETLSLNNNVIRYQPGSNYNNVISGPVRIKLEIEDNGVSGLSATLDPKQAFSTLTVNIAPVNDRPMFTLPNTAINLPEDPTPANQVMVGFLKDIYAGPILDQANGVGAADDEIGNVVGVPGQTVSFNVRALDPTRFAANGQPAIIKTGTNGTFTFTLAPDVNSTNSSGPILVEVIARDNGGGLASQFQSVPQTITINVTPVNDPPEFTLSTTNFLTTEDAPRTVIPAFVSNLIPGPSTAVDEIGQTVDVRVDAVTPAYFAVPPRLTGTGDLEFQLAPNVNSLFSGSLNILVTAFDDGSPSATMVKTLTLTASDINDQPTFTLNKTLIVVPEDNEQQNGVSVTTELGLAKNLFAGPVANPSRGDPGAQDEFGAFPQTPAQVLTFTSISVSNPSLFSQQPAIDGAGNMTFHTAPDRSGSAVVVVRLVDDGRAGPPPNNNLGPTATFTILITPINDAPEFTVPASTTVNEDQGVVSIPGFATGIRPGPGTALDESQQELTFDVRAEDPNVFAVQPTLQVDGTLVFQTKKDVNNNTVGISRKVFVSLRDNGVTTPTPNDNLSDEKTFSININPVNDPPIPDVLKLPGTEDIAMDIQSSVVIAGDAAGPADEVAAGQVVRMTQIERTTDHGGIVTPVFVSGTVVSFRYQPPANYVGDDIIRYVVTDNGVPQESATGTLTVQLAPVNDAPQFIKGADVTVPEDVVPYSAAWATGILAGPPTAVDELAGGVNAQDVSFEISTDNDALFAVKPAVSSTGVLTFTLAKDANGRAIVDVTAVDNGPTGGANINRSATSKLTIVVNPVNDEPGFNVVGNVSVNEDTGRYSGAAIRDIVPAAGMNSSPATGLDEVGQSVSIITSNNNTALFAVQPNISATGVLEFIPAQDAFGTAVVSVIARDNGPSTSPNVNESAPRTFTITIVAANDAPVAVNDRFTTGEDTVLTVAAPGVLANDRDVDMPNDLFTVSDFQTESTLGAIVSMLPNGSFTYDSRSSALLQRLVDGQTATDTFTYTLTDRAGLASNLATVTVTVSGLNDNPVAVNDSFSVPFGISELLNVLANDKDIDSTIDPRTVEIGQLALHGTAVALSTGRIEYRPNAGYRGTDSFTYRVRDSLGAVSNEAVVSIVVNTAPVALADSVLTTVDTPIDIEVLRNDSDPDGSLNRSSVNIASGPDVGTATVLANGSIRYVPPVGFIGTATLQYAVLDNESLSSNLATVTIQVTNSVYQNPSNKLDVNADGFVSPIDVLIVVNDINSNGSRALPDGLAVPPYIDVDGDKFVGPLDVLVLVNFINTRGSAGAGEGEGSMALLGYSQIPILMMPGTEVIPLEEELNALGQAVHPVDLAVSTATRDNLIYGPELAFADTDSDDESLESYLASWDSRKSKRSDSALDSVFADQDWL